MSKQPVDILIGPVISEKSYMLMQKYNQYCFKVARDATKAEIKRAVEEYFGVRVKDVNVVNVKGKERRYRGIRPGRTSEWRKAIVTLPEGEKIEQLFGQL
jgi:large subunit ribosomal protein L23